MGISKLAAIRVKATLVSHSGLHDLSRLGQSGMTIAEVMVAMGLTSVVMLGLGGVMQYSSNYSRNLEVQTGWNSQIQLVQAIANNNASCNSMVSSWPLAPVNTPYAVQSLTLGSSPLLSVTPSTLTFTTGQSSSGIGSGGDGQVISAGATAGTSTTAATKSANGIVVTGISYTLSTPTPLVGAPVGQTGNYTSYFASLNLTAFKGQNGMNAIGGKALPPAAIGLNVYAATGATNLSGCYNAATWDPNANNSSSAAASSSSSADSSSSSVASSAASSSSSSSCAAGTSLMCDSVTGGAYGSGTSTSCRCCDTATQMFCNGACVTKTGGEVCDAHPTTPSDPSH